MAVVIEPQDVIKLSVSNAGMTQRVKTAMNNIKELLLPLLKKYKQDKEMEGYLPTVELLIEDLEQNENNKY